MSLFDYDFLNGKCSKYETNHLHMYVDDNIDFENLENLSDVAYGTIDVFILKDTEDWMRDPYNYNLHIDYNDVLSNIKHNDAALNDL